MYSDHMSAQMLPDQVMERFVTAVREGEFAIEETVPNETLLAERWDVSRLTVREAMRSLMELGVVEIRRGRGTFVRPLSDWSPLDRRTLAARAQGQDGAQVQAQLLEARLIVESGVAELAAARRKEAELAQMEAMVDAMSKSIDEPERFAEADLEFHDVLFGAAGNIFLDAMVKPIHDLLADARQKTSQDPKARRLALTAHRQILQMVRDGSCDGARRAMAEHVAETAASTHGPQQ